VESSNGRLDYIETIKQWRAHFASRSLRKTLMKARLVSRYLTSRQFRPAFTSRASANIVCFEREPLDHFGLVFEKAKREPFRRDEIVIGRRRRHTGYADRNRPLASRAVSYGPSRPVRH
jgi:hypothetical protein